ncbi:ATP-binding cassette domain-containing protein [Halobacillus shinanisalinarum]|uniref:ATP-binding cassette domain-containing protein n=1 Tax=Halobacillus shinanisalinarum TaxID=2932258 RepID=A0ABY4H7K9_9BACI|nr:ATP-binding cassette domain-containing protein [Halobacillus shinanisalinarum]UOQ95552.1 ATP-binding cassette domain-containing protein [Halobacillus shinanisalinarum]
MLSVMIKKKLSNFTLDISLQVGNETVVLFGPSGSGKTTILNCIAGLTHPDEGKIKLNDQTLFHTKSKPIPVQKRKIGYLFQDYALFPHMTVYKNITYGATDLELVDKLVDVVGIKHLLNKYPRQISGGEKQRTALARALATHPDLLLLDEPFSSLDQETKEQCHQELLRLRELWQIPIILVTHDKEEARKLADRILPIKDGHLSMHINE